MAKRVYNQNNNDNHSKQKNNENNKSTILLSAIIIILIIFGSLFLIMYKQSLTTKNEQQALILDTSAEQTEKPNENNGIILAGYNDIVLPAKGKIALENPNANADSGIYIKYEITNNDNQEILYETNLIEPGKQVTWTPSEQLEKGIYNIALIQRPYYMGENNNEYTPTMTVGKNDIKLTVN